MDLQAPSIHAEPPAQPARSARAAQRSPANRLAAAWAGGIARRLACLEPAQQEQAAAIGRFLGSRRGGAFWAALLCATAGTTAGLVEGGLPLPLALGFAVLLWGALPWLGLAVWLTPQAFARRSQIQRFLGLGLAGSCAGAMVGFAAAHWSRHGRLDVRLLGHELAAQAQALAPAVLGVALGLFGLSWSVSWLGRQRLERQLLQATVQQERDAAARQLAEARLRLLQAQIQPHFIFNTLAALQHWVDTGDARAPALLRELTRFLRGSTELLGQPTASLADEAALARHYLAIMQARLGGRLRWQVEIAPELAAQRLPPGLLLTLVENAVEHGVAPSPEGGLVDVRAQRIGGGTLSATATATPPGWELRVADTGAGPAPGWREGLGLGNCRERLQQHFGARARLQLESAQPGLLACITVLEIASS